MTAEAYLAYACQGVLGTVFAAAAASKSRRPSRFAAALHGYALMPPGLVPAMTVLVIVAEWLIAVALLTGLALNLAGPATLVLLLGFGVAVGVNLRRERTIPCGCFGSSTETISHRTLARIGFLALGAALFEVVRRIFDVPRRNLVGLLAQGAVGAEQLSVIAGVGVFLVVVAMWGLHSREVRTVFRRPSKAT